MAQSESVEQKVNDFFISPPFCGGIFIEGAEACRLETVANLKMLVL